MSIQQDREFIDAIGGTVETAALCDVSSQAVSQWRVHGIPAARGMYLRLLRPREAGAAYGNASAQTARRVRPAKASAA